MEERWSSSRGADEWVRVVRSQYASARRRHAVARADAYHITRDEAIDTLCGPELRITDIDGEALAAWEATWGGAHPSGAGGWDWRALAENLPRRAAVLPVAIWHGSDLCGLMLGQASRARWNRSRHTITLTYVERRPEPPPVPLRGRVIALAITIARNYGLIVGARRLCLRAPDRNLLPYYEMYGFRVAWKGNVPVHCEREI